MDGFFFDSLGNQADVFGILLTSLMLSSARLMSFFAVVPMIGKMVPAGLVRTSIVFSLAFLLVPETSAEYLKLSSSLSWPDVLLFIAKEVLIGLVLASIMGTLSWGILAAGYFLDFQRGSTMADAFTPIADESTSYTGVFLIQAYVAFFFSIGGFLVVMQLLYHSYGVWPIFSPMPKISGNAIDIALDVLNQIFSIILVLFGPIIVIMFLAELTLAIYSRFNQQLNVTIIAMPVKTGLMFFAMILMMETIFRYFEETLSIYQTLYESAQELLQ